MGHDPISIKVNRIFVSSERVGPEAEVASFELTATMSSEHYLKEKLEQMCRSSGQIKIKCTPLDLFCFCSYNMSYCSFCCAASPFLKNREDQSSAVPLAAGQVVSSQTNLGAWVAAPGLREQ